MASVKSLPLIEASILSPILSWLNENGANVEAHLDRARIPSEQVASGGWLSKAQVYGFLSDVVRREHCEELAFAAYQHFQMSDLGPLAAKMQSAATFKQSLDVFCRLASRSYEGNEFWLTVDADDAWFCGRVVDNAGDGHAYAQHGSLMVLLQIVRSVAGANWAPRRLCLQAPKTDALRICGGLQECEASFNYQHTAVAFPRELLARSIKRTTNAERTEGNARIGLGDVSDAQDSFADALQRLLASRFPVDGLPTLQETAEIAGTSQRTLKRRLFDDGVNYREVSDRVLFDAARRLLCDTDSSIAEISFELGYSGPNNFVRAFKRISGVTPTEFRKRPAKQ